MKEKNKSGKWIILLAAMTVFFTIGFCYLKFGNQGTLTVGVFCGSIYDVPGTEQYELIDKVIDKFHEKYPNIKVTFQEGIAASDYSEWLSEKILKGEEPDVFIVLKSDIDSLIKTRSLKNLNSDIINDDSFDENVFYDSVYGICQQNGVTYALPFTCNPTMMFINKTLLNNERINLPSEYWTWDDFYDICSQVIRDRDDDGKTDQFGFYDYGWLDAAYSNNVTPFDDQGTKSNITDQKFLDSLSFVQKLNKLQKDTSVSSDDFDLGNVAFRPMTFAEYRTYLPYPWRIKKYSQFEWNCVSMPAGPSGKNASSMDAVMVGMSSRTNKEQMAWEFMKLMTTDPEIQYSVYEYTAGSSVLKDVVCSQKVLDYLNQDTPGDTEIDMSLLDRTISRAVVPTSFDGYDEAFDYLDSHLQNLLQTDDEIRTSVFQLNNELGKYLNQ